MSKTALYFQWEIDRKKLNPKYQRKSSFMEIKTRIHNEKVTQFDSKKYIEFGPKSNKKCFYVD